MKKSSKWVVVSFASVLTVGLLAGCGAKESSDNAADEVTASESAPAEETATESAPVEDGVTEGTPAEVQAVMDHVTDLVTGYAAQLDESGFGDKHVALMESGEGWDYADFKEMKAQLDEFRIESGAYYVYVLVDLDPDDEFFEITVDGSEEPDEWLTQYETEGQFLAAMAGTPTPAPSAWDDAENEPAWSSFAPIHDSEGNVVAILGVDYPAPEILDFPEWNRDSDVFVES